MKFKNGRIPFLNFNSPTQTLEPGKSAANLSTEGRLCTVTAEGRKEIKNQETRNKKSYVNQ